MKTFNVSLVGVGGQGILLTADLLAKTAAVAGMDVKKSEIHGMAQRGGSVISQVRFGTDVASPIIQEGKSDILVSFDKLEALRWEIFQRGQVPFVLQGEAHHVSALLLTQYRRLQYALRAHGFVR
jgi:indolepyruvate ferredoxin oxidoreductase beta subunit